MTNPDALRIKAGAQEWRSLYLGNHPSLKAGAALDPALTPTITVSAGGPALSSKQVFGTKRVKVFVDATGTAAGTYTITVLALTSESTPQKLGGSIDLRVY